MLMSFSALDGTLDWTEDLEVIEHNSLARVPLTRTITLKDDADA